MRLVALIAAAVLLAAPALAAGTDGVSLEVVAGGRAVDTGSTRDAFFQEYGTISDGAVVSWLSLKRELPGSRFSMGFEGRGFTNESQAYEGWFRHAGLGYLTLYYDQTAHHFSNGSTLIHKESSGLYTIDPTMRATWEAEAFGASPVTNLPPLVEQGLATSGRATDVGLRRDRSGFQAQYALGRTWNVRGGLGHEKRTGTRPVSVGTYVRLQPTDSTFDREQFDVRGQDIPEDVDYRTITGDVATDVRGGWGFIEGGVDFTVFRNELLGLQWDNPFEAPGPVRTIDGQSQTNRGRYARGQLALPPDNDFARAHVSGLYRLHRRLRLSATAAMSRMTQDDTFLPFSLNDSIFFPGADGTLGTADDLPATDLSLLPQKSLDGEVKTYRTDLRLSADPARDLGLEATARFYQYDSRTETMYLPGYAAFGESAFRRGIGQKDAAGQSALFNAPSEYIQRQAGLSGTYRFRPELIATAGADRIIWDYTGRQVDKTTEDVLFARLRGMVNDRMDWSAHYRTGSREHDGDYEVGLELSGVRAFDVWDRDRDTYGAEIGVEAGEGLWLGLSAAKTTDDYPGKVESAAHPYGLLSSETTDLALALNYRIDETWGLTGGVGIDQSEWTSLAVAKTPYNADATGSYSPENRWTRNQDDETVWGNIDLAGPLVPGRLTCAIGYSMSLFSGDVVSTNPGTPTINSGLATDWSELRTTTHDFKLQLDYAVAPTMGFVLKYRFVPFRLDDPAWDSLAPYMQGAVTEVRSSASDVRAANASRYLFADYRFDDTDTHVVMLAVRATLK